MFAEILGATQFASEFAGAFGGSGMFGGAPEMSSATSSSSLSSGPFSLSKLGGSTWMLVVAGLVLAWLLLRKK